MNRIAEEVESDPLYPSIIHAQRAEPEATGADAIADAARQIAETLEACGHRLPRHRPARPACAPRASGRVRRSSRSRRLNTATAQTGCRLGRRIAL